jgi:hypothetical protein
MNFTRYYLGGKTMKYLKLIAFAIVILFGCRSMSYLKTDFIDVNKRMTLNEFKSTFSGEFFNTFSIELDGIEYKYLKIEYSFVNHFTFYYNFPVYSKNPFYFIFRDDKFLYCGFLYEMRVHDNIIYRKLAELIFL